MNGKNKCKILKEIRRRIAEENDIAYVTSECKHQGNCLGTCPKCEAEVRYLEEQLAARKRAGYAVALAGLALTVTTATASCTPEGAPTKSETTALEETTSLQDTTISSESTEFIELGGTPLPPEIEMGEVTEEMGEVVEEMGEVVEEMGDVTQEMTGETTEEMTEALMGETILEDWTEQ